MLEKEFYFYKEHQNELVSKYQGKYVVIRDNMVISVFDSEIEAVIESSKLYSLGTFLVQKCDSGIENYSAVFHSRVA